MVSTNVISAAVEQGDEEGIKKGESEK